MRVMTARGLKLADRALWNRVGASLRGMRQRGRVVSGEGQGLEVRWG